MTTRNNGDGKHRLIDVDELRRALKLLAPAGEVVEIRILDAVVGDDRRDGSYFGYFDDHGKLIDALAAVRRAKGIYITLNSVNPALLARAANRLRRADKGDTTSDGDVLSRCWLPIDCDPQGAAGISRTDAEHDAALERSKTIATYLRGLGWPEPIFADSGNGAHLLYPIDLPVDDGGLVQRCLEALAARFDDGRVKVDRKVFNPARIWKLYGTRACKGDFIAGRPHRMSRILTEPEFLSVVPTRLLEELTAEAPEPAAPAAKTPSGSLNGHAPFDVAAFIARHLPGAKGPSPWKGTGRIWELPQSPLCEHHDGQVFIAQQPSGAIVAGCHHNSCTWGWRELRSNFEPHAGRQQRPDEPDRPRAALLVNLADVEAEPVKWLWPGRIALGKLTLLAGDPGLGKSFLSLDIASRVSTGARWPDCSDHAPLGGVVILSAEDDLADTIRPRLDAAGAEVGRIVSLQGVAARDGDGDYERAVDLQRDLDIVEQAIVRVPDCRLLIVDPISAYMGKTDSHKNAEVRSVLAPLAVLAAKHGLAVLAITHLRKGEGLAVYRAMGSLAFAAAARAVWAVAKDQDDPSGKRRLFLPIKNNIGNDQTGLAFGLSVRWSGGTVPCIGWDADPVATTADDALTPAKRRGPEPAERDEAAEFLAKALANGPRKAKELTEEAREAHGISKRTLDRARQALKVVAFREAVPGPWWWRLPGSKAATTDASPPTPEQPGNLGNLAESSGETCESDSEECQGCQDSECGNLGDDGAGDAHLDGQSGRPEFSATDS